MVSKVPWVPGMKQSSISNLGVTVSADALTLGTYNIAVLLIQKMGSYFSFKLGLE